jgi:hypothetical protein
MLPLFADVEVDTDPGASPPHTCDAQTCENDVLNKIVPIPWFDDLDDGGSSGEFHVAGFGAFYVTGYNFGGQFKAPHINEHTPGRSGARKAILSRQHPRAGTSVGRTADWSSSSSRSRKQRG